MPEDNGGPTRYVTNYIGPSLVLLFRLKINKCVHKNQCAALKAQIEFNEFNFIRTQPSGVGESNFRDPIISLALKSGKYDLYFASIKPKLSPGQPCPCPSRHATACRKHLYRRLK
ncbi:hypothetical protein AVEN_31301-1 [Araneus ventricosus]|uniref:Uncharacterized protein n=1 Tax=Araneus ventricosus TaxID=182803 RepID=A0A4Y2G7A5_ARAVE|nr:hypothetical protein AVEN_31301-1 [Araneus ventricosus]